MKLRAELYLFKTARATTWVGKMRDKEANRLSFPVSLDSNVVACERFTRLHGIKMGKKFSLRN